MPDRDVIIVGGGVIGLSAAYHLVRSGSSRVVILEKDHIGAGSSSRAAGITTGLLWTETGVRARQLGIEWFKRLSQELPGYRYHDEQGCLNLMTPQTWPLRQPLLALYDRVGVAYDVLSAAEIRRRWPALHPPDDFLGMHDPHGGYSEPDEYIPALTRRIQELGVEIIEGERAIELLTTSGRVSGVRTTAREHHADIVISGVHAWTPQLWQHLGLRLPMKSFVHQRYVSAPLPTPLIAPPVNADPYLGYIRPAHGGRMLLGVETPQREQFDVTTADFRMSDLTVDTDVRERAVRSFESFAPCVKDAQWERKSIGLISFSMDGEPLLGPVARLPGLLIAGAFHSGGFSYNTVAGVLLAEMASGCPTSVDVSAFSPDRFSTTAAEAYLSTPVVQGDAVRRRH